MQELEKKLDALELKLLNEVVEATENSTNIWKSIGILGDLMRDVIRDIGELRTDINKLIENNCDRKSA